MLRAVLPSSGWQSVSNPFRAGGEALAIPSADCPRGSSEFQTPSERAVRRWDGEMRKYAGTEFPFQTPSERAVRRWHLHLRGQHRRGRGFKPLQSGR